MSTVDETGMTIDRYDEVRSALAAAVRSVLGDTAGVDDEDAVIGMIVTIISETVADQNEEIEYTKDSFDVDNATGTDLKKLIKLNGITANEGLYSTVSLSCTANAYGCTIPSGSIVRDPSRTSITYATDSELVLAADTTDTVSATCTAVGANEASANTLTEIVTPEPGWSTVTNPAAASPGQNEETSTEMRARRNRAARSRGPSTLYGITKALEDLDSTTEVAVYENRTNKQNALGIPPRSIWAIVVGDTDENVATALFGTAACRTFGGSSYEVTYLGHGYTMYFDRATDVYVDIDVTFAPINQHAPAEWLSGSEDTIRETIETWMEANQKLGMDATPQAIAGALASVVDGYYVSECLICEHGGTPASFVVELEPDERARTDSAYVDVAHT